jgi:DNA-3-methyladenine glycosylase
VAQDLLGRYLIRTTADGARAVGRIIETEAYLGAKDRASHTFGGRRTARTETMYRAGGCAYVYLIYGIHHCINVVTGPEGEAQAVLLRAIEPVEGAEWMRANRSLGERVRPGDVGGGPGKLCQAMQIDRGLDGASLLRGELRCAEGRPARAVEVARGPRIGVDYAGEAAAWPLRFAIAGHTGMSRPRLER